MKYYLATKNNSGYEDYIPCIVKLKKEKQLLSYSVYNVTLFFVNTFIINKNIDGKSS